MASPKRFFGLGLAMLVCSAAPVLAGGPAVSDIYRLNSASTYQFGCWPPCLCPISPLFDTRGTFRLTPTDFDGLFQHYDVTDVNWTVASGDPELRVTGTGTYKVGGEFAVMQQLELDLYVGREPLQHFDSGLVVGGGGFPDIQITISMNGMYCFDMVFVIDASPVPASEIAPYHLTMQATYQHGCRGPCDCPPGPIRPITGTFALVPLVVNPLFTEYAVVDVDWQVTPMPPLPDVALHGVGTYRVGGEVAVQHQMQLDLTDAPGSAPQHFDSGWVAGGGNFPLIDITISFQESVCIETVIEVHAAPSVLIASANPPAQNPYVPGVHPFRDVLQTGGGATLQQGIGSCQTPNEGGVSYCNVVLTFTAPITLTLAEVTLTCSYTGDPPGSTPCPTVSAVNGSGGGPYTISLSGVIPPGGCATLTFGNAAPDQALRYESLPGDVSMDALSNTSDLLALVQGLQSGAANQPANLARYDINRTGAVNTTDLLRLVQLLNGVNTTRAWNGAALVPCD
jgi:hypothetical protein